MLYETTTYELQVSLVTQTVTRGGLLSRSRDGVGAWTQVYACVYQADSEVRRFCLPDQGTSVPTAITQAVGRLARRSPTNGVFQSPWRSLVVCPRLLPVKQRYGLPRRLRAELFRELQGEESVRLSGRRTPQQRPPWSDPQSGRLRTGLPVRLRRELPGEWSSGFPGRWRTRLSARRRTG